MNDYSALQWAILAGAALLIGVSKTGLPGVGILAILMAAQVIPSKQSTGLILPLLIVGDIFAVAYYRRHAVWKYLVRLLPFSATGVVLGALAMKQVTNEQLRPIIGGIVLVLLILSYLHHRKPDAQVPDGWWFPVVMGLAGGTTTMMANAAGPIMVIYLLAMRLPRNAFLGTGAWYFLLINCFKVPFSTGLDLINPESLHINLMLAPLVVIGALVGVRLVKHVPEKAFNIIVQLLAAAAAVDMLLRPPQ
jgi:uncharacterized membrane protein YfcA